MTGALAEQIGERLKQGRRALGYTQKRVAEAVGGKLRGWQEYESGRSVPGGAVLAALVDLGLNANWVLTGKGPMLLSELTAPAGAMDRELLEACIEGVEVGLQQAGRIMPPEPKAQLILAMYDLFEESDARVDTGTVIQFVRRTAG